MSPVPTSELGAAFYRRCFAFPEEVPGRRHGPRGYAHYEAYRAWLRDEFLYRCAYCLMREPWLRGRLGFQIDHCIPQVQAAAGRLDYDNLVYSCPRCNQAKAGVAVPNPTQVAYGTALWVKEDGVIEAKNALGQILLDGLKLDHPELTRQRHLIGATAILAELKALGVRPLPNPRTIERVLERNGLTAPRVRLALLLPRQEWPGPQARASNEWHEVDLVGPVYLQGCRHRYSIWVGKDAFDGAVCPRLASSRTMDEVLWFLGECGKDLGRPEQVQFDNARELAGWGSRRAPCRG